LERCKYEYGKDSYNKIMNKISYEILNKNEEDKEMRKFLIGGLVLSLLLGLNGCKHEPEPEKVVDAKYIGEYWLTTDSDKVYKLIVKETEIVYHSSPIGIDVDLATYPEAEAETVWTEGDGYAYLRYIEPEHTIASGQLLPSRTTTFGYFTDENTFISLEFFHPYKSEFKRH
jgi:hypothetical protein